MTETAFIVVLAFTYWDACQDYLTPAPVKDLKQLQIRCDELDLEKPTWTVRPKARPEYRKD